MGYAERMVTSETTARVAPYRARPGRHALVALRLAELQGPVAGTIELPLHLFWSGDFRTFDIGNPGTLQWVYETVLQGASRPADLALLNGEKLAELWPDLFLPRGVRQAWEDEHPELRTAAAA